MVKQEAPKATEPIAQKPVEPLPERKRLVIEKEITYGELARELGTTVEMLNKLNKLNLDANTLIAKGSELYVPPQTPWS